MLLYLVRHGETEFNAAGRIQGQLDSPLSSLGLKQCLAIAEGLAGEPIQAVVCSPLRRAAETAGPIADRLKLPITHDPRWMEINAGLFQGHCWDEIGKKWPEEAKQWRTQDPDFRLPEGESRRDLMRRTFEALEAIRAMNLEHVLVVAHGGTVSAALKVLLEVPAERNPFAIQNASINRVAWRASEVKLITYNEVNHLHGILGGAGDL